MYYNGQIGYAPTLADALAKVFGVQVGQAGAGASPPTPGGRPAPRRARTVQKYLQQAETFYNQAQAALKSGNLAAFGTDLAKMKAALDKAQKAATGQPVTRRRRPRRPHPPARHQCDAR